MKRRPRGREIHMTDTTHKHLTMSALHFGCSKGTLLDMLLAAVRIAEMPESDNPKTLMAIECFEKHLSNIDLTKHTYIFKD